MKGIVFTELIEMVEQQFSPELMDQVLSECDLETGGAYTSIGTYDHQELIEIVSALSHKTDISVSNLIRHFGHHLFFRFHELMPQFFEEPKTAFEFLETVHHRVHVEVKKLYPDAALPEFKTEKPDLKTLVMTYHSNCPFADFAYGLIEGCIEFYQENIEVDYVDQNKKNAYSRIFTLRNNNGSTSV